MAIINNPVIIKKGGFDIAPYITASSSNNYPLFGVDAQFPDNTDLNLNLTSLKGTSFLFYGNQSVGLSVTLNLPTNLINYSGITYATNIKRIVFLNSLENVRSWGSFARNNTVLEEIVGEIDLSNSNASSVEYMFTSNSNMREIRFKENTIKIAFGHPRYGGGINQLPNLSDDSLISIANAIKDGEAGLTLTLAATSKTRCGQILGIVSSHGYWVEMSSSDFIVTNVDFTIFDQKVLGAGGSYSFDFDGTNWQLNSNSVILSEYGITTDGTPRSGNWFEVVLYHIFTADETGDTYLDDFITDVKGWSLA